MVRLVTDDDIGLKVLREPPAEAIATQIIDIVAIHGIGAHPDDSWCKNVGTAESAQWVNWLDKEDMLPAVAPNARIMRYGYQSTWFGKRAMRQSTKSVAQRMLIALEDPSRPLMFISHCFGGLVVLKALVDARHYMSKWPGVSTSTTSLIFFGTPFRGAEGMKLVEMLEAARSQYQEDEVQTTVLEILEPGNEYLLGLVDDFGETQTPANKAEIACFYELIPSDVGKIVGTQNRTRFVVSESSGCLDLSDAVSKFSLSRTHFDMNKFGKSTEEDFETVGDVIQKMVNGAHALLQTRPQSKESVWEYKDAPPPILTQNPKALPKAPAITTPVSRPLTSKTPGSNKKKKKPAPEPFIPWSPAEDEKLLHTVQAMGLKNWKQVAPLFEDRAPFACQKRYEKLT